MFSRKNRAIQLRAVLILALWLVCVPRPACGQCADWAPSNEPSVAGLPGAVHAFAEWDPDGDGPQPIRLVAAGSFVRADGVPLNRIAYFDGSIWQPIGDGLPFTVRALAVMNGQLFAGGQLYSDAGGAARYVHRWNGTAWERVGDRFNNYVLSLLVHKGELYAGGNFFECGTQYVGSVVRWDGLRWVSVGNPSGGVVLCLAEHQGDLYIGGSVNSLLAGPMVAKWNGSSWTNLSYQRLDGEYVADLVEYQGNLVACGPFGLLPTAGVPNRSTFLASWNGTAWQGMGCEVQVLANCIVEAVVFEDQIHFGGDFSGFRPMIDGDVGFWDGSSIRTLGEGLTGADLNFVYVVDAFEGRLIAGGRFKQSGQENVPNVAEWDGERWTPIGKLAGLDSAPICAVEFRNELVLGGTFLSVGGHAIPNLAMRNGSEWHAIGPSRPGTVYDLQSMNEGMAVAAPNIPLPDGSTTNIGIWTGSKWEPIGEAFNSTPLALALVSGVLVAGGNLTSSGPVALRDIAAFDGAAWQPLGEGLGLGASDAVFAIVEYQDAIFAGGSFQRTGTGLVVNRIARWTGSEWTPVGTGVNDQVLALAVYEGDLVVGGRFRSAGSVEACGIARWDGTEWHAMGAGVAANQYVAGLTNYQRRLIAYGSFDRMDGLTVNSIASWRDSAWRPLPVSISRASSAALLTMTEALEFGGELYVFGDFNIVDAQVSRYWFRWDGRLRGDANQDLLVDHSDISAVLSAWATPGPPGDANFDGVVDFDDITTAISNWAASCD